MGDILKNLVFGTLLKLSCGNAINEIAHEIKINGLILHSTAKYIIFVI
jgi:hypothetical protein